MPTQPSTPAARIRAALDAQQAGNFAAAQHLLLEVARDLLMQAQAEAAAPARRALLEQAERVRARAETLDAQVAAQKAARHAQEDAARRATPALAESEDVPTWLLAERPSVRLADVAGLEEAKQQVHLKLIYPFSHPEAAARFKVPPGGGVLLYGPPGTGKTYFARAVAGELDATFFVAKASTLMSQWVGKAEQNVAALFAAARAMPKAVVFIDEIEALVPARGSSSSSVMPRVISEFLSQMQSLGNHEGGALLLLGATNLPWAIDAAALRPGRFDALIYVGLPDAAARLQLLQLNLAGRPLDPTVDLSALAQRTEGYSGADIAHICLRSAQRAFLDEVLHGMQRSIDAADLDAALEERKPSVAPADLRRLEKFRTDHESQS